jgi:flagellar hook-basal body complex protein FliE
MNISGLGQAIGQIQSSIQSSVTASSGAATSSSSGVSPFSSPTLPSTGSGQASSFGEVLSGAIGEVESARSNAATSVEQFLAGNGDDLHTTVLATQRAELEFEMFMQVRNKVVSAYQEIMKLQM